MLLESRRGQIFLGLLLLVTPVLVIRVILVVSGAIPGMTWLSNPPADQPIDLRAIWAGYWVGWKVLIVVLFFASVFGLRLLARGVFGSLAGRE